MGAYFCYKKVENVYFYKVHSLWNRETIEMMGLIGMGNNPMVGATVAVAVAVEEGMK